ncbi:hypothetical protein KAR91_53855 [Candidatus Pacearchaeota archaeon]|nr:hypothetical protein [Candidatus Pacearchaeota archaeon]
MSKDHIGNIASFLSGIRKSKLGSKITGGLKKVALSSFDELDELAKKTGEKAKDAVTEAVSECYEEGKEVLKEALSEEKEDGRKGTTK